MSQKRTLIDRLRKIYSQTPIEDQKLPKIIEKQLIFKKNLKFPLESQTRWKPKDVERAYSLGDLFLFLENCRKKGSLGAYMESWRQMTKKHGFGFQLISNKHREHTKK